MIWAYGGRQMGHNCRGVWGQRGCELPGETYEVRRFAMEADKGGDPGLRPALLGVSNAKAAFRKREGGLLPSGAVSGRTTKSATATRRAPEGTCGTRGSFEGTFRGGVGS